MSEKSARCSYCGQRASHSRYPVYYPFEKRFLHNDRLRRGGALALARAVHPDLLISDVVMPEMTGVELAIAVTENRSGIQGLVVFRPGRDCHRGHDFTILTKPVHPTHSSRNSTSVRSRPPGIVSMRRSNPGMAAGAVYLATDETLLSPARSRVLKADTPLDTPHFR
jgi:hypothetical protein